MRRALAAVMTLAVLAVGCGSGGGGGDEQGGEELTPDSDVIRDVPSRLVVDVKGTVEFGFEGDVDLLTTLLDEESGTDLRFLSVGLENMQDLPDGPAFRVAFDFPGAFDGAGEYQLGAVGGTATTLPSLDPENPDPNAAVAGLSRAFVIYNAEGNAETDPALAAGQRSFEIIVQPCDLTIEDDKGEQGRLTCPELADRDGNTVSLDMRWERR